MESSMPFLENIQHQGGKLPCLSNALEGWLPLKQCFFLFASTLFRDINLIRQEDDFLILDDFQILIFGVKIQPYLFGLVVTQNSTKHFQMLTAFKENLW